MQPMFQALAKLFEEPLLPGKRLKTDQSIVLVYPPSRELDFREGVEHELLPWLEARRVPCQVLDLSGFLFENLDARTVATCQVEEFEDYEWMVQGLAQRMQAALRDRLLEVGKAHPGTNLLLCGTVALFPLVRFGEVLRDVRDLPVRLAVAFPGEERGGRLHFMSQPDGGNYLAVKLFWQ